jgi:hypothetical protein
MLVKLGDVWVDPTKVVMLEPGLSVAITTETRSALSAGGIDDFAAIINNSVGQTYGGGDEENPADA